MSLGTTEFAVDGVDLKRIFELRQGGDDAVDPTGFYDTDDKQDLAEWFAPLSVGTRIDGDTGYTVNGVDLADIFAARYSRPDTPLSASLPDTAGGSCSTSGSTCTANATIKVTAGGGFPGYTYDWTVTGATITAGQGTDTITLAADPTGAGNVQATLSCVVSDSQSGVVNTNDCVVTFAYVYFSDLEASLPGSARATCRTSDSSCVASVDVPCSASKGQTPYSYHWDILGGSCSFLNGSRDESVATVARSTSGTPRATLRCRVTDASGNIVFTNHCSVTFEYTYLNDLSVSIPDSLSGDCSTKNDACTTHEVVFATVRGGKPPFSYFWEYIDGNTSSAFPGGPYRNYIDVQNRTDGHTFIKFKVKVIDSLGYSAYSNVCTFTADYHYINDLAVSVPSSRTATCYTSNASCAASVDITASVSGGKDPYNYDWRHRSGHGHVHSGQNSRTCTVDADTSGSIQGTYRCKVTDNGGYVKYSNNCAVTFNYSYTGGGGGCIALDAWADFGLRAVDARAGRRLDCLRGASQHLRLPIRDILKIANADCVRLVTVSGAALRLSAETPVNLRTAQYDLHAGHYKRAENMLGHDIATLKDTRSHRLARAVSRVIPSGWGGRRLRRRYAPRVIWETVVGVERIGEHPVVWISLGRETYAAGEDPYNRIFAHNKIDVGVNNPYPGYRTT